MPQIPSKSKKWQESPIANVPKQLELDTFWLEKSMRDLEESNKDLQADLEDLSSKLVDLEVTVRDLINLLEKKTEALDAEDTL